MSGVNTTNVRHIMCGEHVISGVFTSHCDPCTRLRRVELKRLGICTLCGIHKVSDSLTSCRKCRKRRKNDCNEYRRQRRIAEPEWQGKLLRDAYIKLKQQVFAAYGGEYPKCACPPCGEDDVKFLTIDHINGGGQAHRKDTHKSVYRWLRKNNYPPGFQLLCWNCNCARAQYNGICPHLD